jgi:hypothetical protein
MRLAREFIWQYNLHMTLQVPIAFAKEFYELSPSQRTELVRNFRITSRAGYSSSTYIGELKARGLSDGLVSWFEYNSQLIGEDFDVYTDSLAIADDLDYDSRLADYERLSGIKRGNMLIGKYALWVGGLLFLLAVGAAVVVGTTYKISPNVFALLSGVFFLSLTALLLSAIMHALAKHLPVAKVLTSWVLLWFFSRVLLYTPLAGTGYKTVIDIAVLCVPPFVVALWPDRSRLAVPTKPSTYELLKQLRSMLAEEAETNKGRETNPEAGSKSAMSQPQSSESNEFVSEANPARQEQAPELVDSDPEILGRSWPEKTVELESTESKTDPTTSVRQNIGSSAADELDTKLSAASEQASPEGNHGSSLAKLFDLYRSGAITDAEFKELRSQYPD